MLPELPSQYNDCLVIERHGGRFTCLRLIGMYPSDSTFEIDL